MAYFTLSWHRFFYFAVLLLGLLVFPMAQWRGICALKQIGKSALPCGWAKPWPGHTFLLNWSVSFQVETTGATAAQGPVTLTRTG